MKIIEYYYGQTPDISECVLALGYFDGLHLGHRKLLLAARSEAKNRGLSFGVFTFATGEHTKPGAKKLLSDATKASLLERLGADFVIFADFPSIAGLEAEKFAKEVLYQTFKTRVAVAGFNYRFGKGALGDAPLLSSVMKSLGADVIILDDFRLDGETVSTTGIREALLRANLSLVNRYLGYTYFIPGEVMRGRKVGTKLGFPTINTSFDKSIASPKAGVYSTVTVIDGAAYPSITNVGVCPTFAPREKHLETYLFDFDGDLYGKKANIHFIDYLREEKRFSDEKDLIMQINIDKNKVLQNIGDIKWQDFGQS